MVKCVVSGCQSRVTNVARGIFNRPPKRFFNFPEDTARVKRSPGEAALSYSVSSYGGLCYHTLRWLNQAGRKQAAASRPPCSARQTIRTSDLDQKPSDLLQCEVTEGYRGKVQLFPLSPPPSSGWTRSTVVVLGLAAMLTSVVSVNIWTRAKEMREESAPLMWVESAPLMWVESAPLMWVESAPLMREESAPLMSVMRKRKRKMAFRTHLEDGRQRPLQAAWCKVLRVWTGSRACREGPVGRGLWGGETCSGSSGRLLIGSEVFVVHQ
ncbi:hypothetical protein EYF80_040036 [Liparis tanakae]|uniref:Uncharacterized protein n=1 Tax=Liparis tanakae TaxID=230148 RepID=A0A4Z2GAB6_9TELE|nr:hypothetical protein EYF80_040036 [Liparis tanakae]